MEAIQNLPPTAGPPGFAFLDDQRIRQFKERTFTLLEKHGVFLFAMKELKHLCAGSVSVTVRLAREMVYAK